MCVRDGARGKVAVACGDRLAQASACLHMKEVMTDSEAAPAEETSRLTFIIQKWGSHGLQEETRFAKISDLKNSIAHLSCRASIDGVFSPW